MLSSQVEKILPLLEKENEVQEQFNSAVETKVILSAEKNKIDELVAKDREAQREREFLAKTLELSDEKIKEISQTILEHDKAKQTAEDLRKKIRGKDEWIESLAAALRQKDSVEKQIQHSGDEDKKVINALKLEPRRIDNNAEIASLGEQILDLEKNPNCPSGEACPYYGKVTDHLHKYKKQRDELIRAEEQNEARWKEWKKDFDSIVIAPADNSEMFAEMARLNGMIINYDRKVNDINRAEEDLANFERVDSTINDLALRRATEEEKRKEIKKQIEEITVTEGQIDKNRSLQKALVDSLKEIETLFVEAQAQMTSIKIHKKELEETEAALSTAKEELKRIEEEMRKALMVKEAFGQKGIRTVVLDFVLPRLEEKCNQILSQMSDFQVRFDTQKKTADEEGVKEGLYITIINEIGEEMDFSNYSGGERLKITVSITEALSTLQNMGFKLIDELFVGLDENTTESFVEVLMNLQKKANQMICISHLPEIKELFDNKVVISKNKGNSYVTKRS